VLAVGWGHDSGSGKVLFHNYTRSHIK
jgi:hypothetical protein